MLVSQIFLILVISIFSHVFSIPINNGILTPPEVSCGANSVVVYFNTQNPFEGSLFSKGFSDQESCRVGGTSTLAPSFTLSLANQNCGLRRLRSANPPGISVEFTLIISFHPMFITKVDRAFKISCFYMEAEKSVSSEIEVSMLTTVIVEMPAQMPVCKYEILQGSITGPPIRFAKVGDQVYHKWTCESPNKGMYCMRVHSCFVDSGTTDKKVDVIDDEGCAVDRHVLQSLDYLTDLMAGQEAHVFKFADKPQVFFNCMVEIMTKEESCDLIQPNCPRLRKRSIRNETILANIDLEPPHLNVFDLEGSNDVYNRDLNIEVFAATDAKICLSQSGYAFYLTVIALVTLMAVIINILLIVCIWTRNKGRRRYG